jgi:hypothetical protein
MRHLYGFLLALVLSAALFFGGGIGVWRIVTEPAAGRTPSAFTLTGMHGVLPLAALLGTSLLLGILLIAQRASPLCTGLPGLALLGWSALLVLRGRYAMRFVPLPASHFAAGFSLLLSSGMLGLLGTLMVIPLLRPSRWWRRPVEDYDADEDDIDVPTALGLVP